MNATLTKRLIALASVALAGALGAGLPARPAQALVILSGCGDASSVFGLDCSLGELIDPAAPGSITIDNTLFDQWSFSAQADFGPPTLTDPDQIKVTPIGEGTLDPGPGVKFTATGAAWSIAVSANSAYSETDTIGFRVSTTDGAARISDNRLRFAGWADGFLSGVTVNEVATDHSGAQVANKTVHRNIPGGPPVYDASATFATPLSEIFVTTQAFLLASPIAGSASAIITSISQNFSQLPTTTTQVPEPGTLLLFGAGLAGLAFARRRGAGRGARCRAARGERLVR